MNPREFNVEELVMDFYRDYRNACAQLGQEVPTWDKLGIPSRNAFRSAMASCASHVQKPCEPEWTNALPNECGLYWWWNGDENGLPIAVDIFVNQGDKTYFAPAGQHGWNRFQFVKEMGGLWSRLYQPLPPAPKPQEEK